MLKPTAPTGTIALVAVEILKSMHSLDEGGEYQRARDSYFLMKEKGHNLTPYSWHKNEMAKAVGLAWEIVEMVDEMRPEVTK